MAVNASAINTPLEALFDRTAVLVPDVQVFPYTGVTDYYTVPPHALWIEIVVVGGGGRGGNTPSGYQHAGAGGGGSGEVVRRVLPASLIGVGTQLAVRVGHGAAMGTGTSDASTVSRLADGIAITAAGGLNGADAGDTDGGAGGAGGAGVAAEHGSGSAAGGAGANAASGVGTGGDGGYGQIALRAQGGDNGGLEAGDPGAGGSRGQGYGAGGGGSGGGTYFNYADGAGGGGGGGGGYGVGNFAGHGMQGAANVNTPAYGGAGAPGIVIITAWRGAPAA